MRCTQRFLACIVKCLASDFELLFFFLSCSGSVYTDQDFPWSPTNTFLFEKDVVTAERPTGGGSPVWTNGARIRVSVADAELQKAGPSTLEVVMDFQPFKTCVTRVDFLQVRTCLQALPRARLI